MIDGTIDIDNLTEEEWKLIRGKIILSDAVVNFRANEHEISMEHAKRFSEAMRQKLNYIDSIANKLGYIEDAEIVDTVKEKTKAVETKNVSWLKKKLAEAAKKKSKK